MMENKTVPRGFLRSSWNSVLERDGLKKMRELAEGSKNILETRQELSKVHNVGMTGVKESQRHQPFSKV